MNNVVGNDINGAEDAYVADFPERLSGETEEQYGVFLAFVQMGTGRSISALSRLLDELEDAGVSGYRGAKSVTALRNWAREFHWADRCREFDRGANDERAEFLRQRNAVSKLQRVTAFSDTFSRLADHLGNIGVEELDVKETVTAMKIVAEQLREEFDDLPVRRSEETLRRVDVSPEQLKDMDAGEAQEICLRLVGDSSG